MFRRRILVVDDEVMVRELLTAILERADYEVILAEDGLRGVEMAASERPDLVIIDGLLPKLHGFLACKAIKELSPAPRVILLTGIYTKPNYKWEAKVQYGADELLTKPTGPAELLDCVEKLLAGLPRLDRSVSHQPVNSAERPYGMNPPASGHANRAIKPAPAGYSATFRGTIPSKGELVPASRNRIRTDAIERYNEVAIREVVGSEMGT